MEAIEHGDDASIMTWALAFGAKRTCSICGADIVVSDSFAEAAADHYKDDEFDENIPWKIEMALEDGSVETGGKGNLCSYHADQAAKDD